MKNLHNAIGNFHFPENKPCFWVREIMHCSQLNVMQQGKDRPYVYVPTISKLIQNTLNR